MKYRNSIGAAMVATLLASASAMADDSTAGWYVGANLGQSDAHIDKGQLDDIWARQGASASTSFDDKDLAYSLSGGYRFNKFSTLRNAQRLNSPDLHGFSRRSGGMNCYAALCNEFIQPSEEELTISFENNMLGKARKKVMV